jgi:hypothetical protein
VIKLLTKLWSPPAVDPEEGLCATAAAYVAAGYLPPAPAPIRARSRAHAAGDAMPSWVRWPGSLFQIRFFRFL